jgi:drug/metabolite transporter (DMT)-like permease
MIAVLAGTGAALAFGVSTVCSARASREIGAASTLAAVAFVGLVVALPFAATSGTPRALGVSTVVWLGGSGAGNALGLLLAYRALRAGKVAIVAPILSVEGAVAALLAVAGGQALSALAAGALAVIASGVVLAGTARSTAATASPWSAGVPSAAAAAACFGVGLYATGRAGAVLPLAWAILPPRVVGTAALTLPLLAAGRLRVTRTATPLLACAGGCEVAGFALYTFGARSDIAVTAILASLFGAVAAILGRLVFRERLARLQLAGVATIIAGVAALTAVTN